MRLDGGGYVTGIIPHSDGTIYARTDISGLFKKNADGSWTQMFDFLKTSEMNLMGVIGTAIAPQDSNTVYVATGQVSSKNGSALNGEVFKTTDGGKTWTKAGLSKPFGANEAGKICGEVVAVSPYDINTVYVLTKTDGLWRTTDGAKTWQSVESFPSSGNSGGFVEFSKTSSDTVYVNITGEGMYKSTDNGVSWALTASTPTNLRRVAQKADGELLCSADDGIYRYKNDAWSCVYQRDVSSSGMRAGIGGIDIDPYNANHIVAITSVGSDGSTGLGNNHILESYDGGNTFTDRYDDHSNSTNNNFVNSSVFINQFTSASSIVFDKQRAGVVYISDWYGIFETGNIQNKPISVFRSSKGIENTLSYAVKAIPGEYSLMAGFADVGAMGWSNIGAMAQRMKSANTDIQDATEFDYCEKHPEMIVRVGAYHKDSDGNKNAGLAGTTDGGKNWVSATLPETWTKGLGASIHIGVHVALSSDINAQGFPTIVMTGRDGVYYSDDCANTWSKSSGVEYIAHGLWIYNTPLVSDRVDNDTFYLCQDNNFYVSRDGGKTFSVYNSNVPDAQRYVQLVASPDTAGTLVLTTGTGVYITKDYGKTFTKTGNFVAPKKSAFGKGETNPILYVFDADDKHSGLYMSPDMGENWHKVKTQNNNFCGITDMDADKTTEGLVYISTHNRGVFSLEVK